MRTMGRERGGGGETPCDEQRQRRRCITRTQLFQVHAGGMRISHQSPVTGTGLLKGSRTRTQTITIYLTLPCTTREQFQLQLTVTKSKLYPPVFLLPHTFPNYQSINQSTNISISLNEREREGLFSPDDARTRTGKVSPRSHRCQL